MSDLERELERELHRVLDPISRLQIPPRRTGGNMTLVQRLVGGAGAAVAFKVATGIVAAAAAVTVAGAATTGSLNPQTWGQQVSQRVQDCKESLRAPGSRGIGECVSPFASSHGQAVASAARHHGKGDGPDEGKGQGGNGGHGKDGSNRTGSGGTGGSGSGHDGGSGVPPTPPRGGSTGKHTP